VTPEHHYPAELYELIHRGTPGDLGFYREACAGARRILELGCGYGRVVSALSELEAEITGLDRDAGLLARAADRVAALPSARRARVHLVVADMTSFDLVVNDSPGFDRILIPHSGLYCLLNDEAAVDCFRCVARHLAPGGELLIDAYAADEFHATAKPEAHVDADLSPVVSVEHDAATYDVFERSCWDRTAQRLDVTYEYIPRDGGDALQGSLSHRYLVGQQLTELLERGGLRLVSLADGWKAASNGAGTPLRSDAEFFVARAVVCP
jgi:SAM-dependent methyltransferase